MPIEQMLFALNAEGAYEFLKSPGVDGLLTDASIRNLRQTTMDKAVYWLPTEQVVAVQHVEHVQDENKRDGIWNHTVLVPISEYLNLTDPWRVLEGNILRRDAGMPKVLESINVKGG